MNQKPTQKVRWPNVALTSLPQFETSLDTWFGRKNIPVWITEYGNETKPGEPKGVTDAQQASYVTQAIDIAKKDKRVPMFIWFVLRDSAGSLWQSGIYRTTGAAKPSQPKFAAAARPLDPVNGKVSVKGGTKNPALTVYLRAFCANNPVGAHGRAQLDDDAWPGRSSPSPSRRSALAIDCTTCVPRHRAHGRQGQDVHGHGRGQHDERRRGDSGRSRSSALRPLRISRQQAAGDRRRPSDTCKEKENSR